MKKILNKIKNWIVSYYPYVVFIMLIVFSLCLAYVVAKIDMPDWLKFWLFMG